MCQRWPILREDRERIRAALVTEALERMARQGIQHTTVEQIYKAVGISRTFSIHFSDERGPDRGDPLSPATQDTGLRGAADGRSGTDLAGGVRQFLHACCYGEKNGIAVLTIEEQQLIFRRLSADNCRVFREKQARLFGKILECFGVRADRDRVELFTNLSLTAMIVRRAIPESLPLFVPEAADATVAFQIDAIVDRLERLKEQGS